MQCDFLTSESGQSKRGGKMVPYRVSSEAAAFYMDVSNKAAFIVWRAGDTDSDTFLFFGTYQHGNQELLVQPPASSGTGHTVTEIEETSPTGTDFLINPEFDASRVEQLESSNAKDSNRTKRQTTDYEVEIFFVIDYSLYSFWYMQMTGTDIEKQSSAISTIKQFYAFVLNAMSIRYNSVTGSGYSITLIYAGISIATRSTDAPYIEDNLEENYVDGRRVFLTNSVLPAFKDWGNKNLKPIYNFDVAMMFTNYQMQRFFNNTFESLRGIAYRPGACTDWKYSITEYYFGARLVSTASHELGHNLFAQHDGTVDGTGENCSSADMYVMGVPRSMSSDDVRNIRQFSFSSCSMDYFTAYIKTLNTGENCLATRSANYNTSDLNPYLGDLAGQVYTPDQQCEYILGAGSYLSRITYQSNYSGICSRMNCVIPGTNGTYYYKLAWEGTTCGDGKMCSGGSCVTSSRAPAVAAEECMFGNNPSIVTYETVTCNELLAFPNTSYKCYQSYCLNDCCETCEQIRLKNVNTTDCDYGDKASWCETMSLSGCYNNDDVCCQSCPRRALGIQNCTYGDRSTSCNVDKCSTYTEDSRTRICCKTCANTETTTSIPTTTTPTTITSTTTTPTTTTPTTTTPTTTTPTTTTPTTTTPTTTTPTTTTPTTTTPTTTTPTTTTPTTTIPTTTTPTITTPTTTTPTTTTTSQTKTTTSRSPTTTKPATSSATVSRRRIRVTVIFLLLLFRMSI
ncbi:uncharacterized protein LOC128221214 isoform X1 [Mya arenaria]|uniref:uncharacterized protein LOC128221214 isoform X1 n=3 Tax=Mya arenaria TaxID=6604 RepID=UPI0022E285C5|nr:uncharacterized protein LOC128221214 isoform X1 [Mya arenaria]XP_052785673.1 uncharacterized protein LOC128221214 isoform X1 [Mya arenaria]XP_052785674.1 uncharacterized protein LOC128221214 isoform X1 [Mya arenaria]XP_052785676.1 uncharacterized protein LOC128221214 isoform X1 [Mya arenaria]